jgi:MoaA/NifB/PqqE/SkfB family radical SAM enzyme
MPGKGSVPGPLSPADDIVFREKVATNVRFWLRISRVCNNRCLFCHDSILQDGVFLGFDELKKQIIEARERGAERLILSGGEATIHPRFVDLVSEARTAGYDWVQSISNGRMFAYRDFAERAVRAGLNEVTISIHGPNAEINDRLTGIKGSFDQAVAGMKNLMRSGCLVTADVVINTANYRYLSSMIRTFFKLGIREFDLLYITPFGRAFDKNPDLLFRLENGRPSQESADSLAEAIDTGRRLGCTIWTNRVPPELLEGFEGYIQDPHKVTDEVRGRADLFEELIDGLEMRCREAPRCDLCFVKELCAALTSDVTSVRNKAIKSAVARPALVDDSVLRFLEDAVGDCPNGGLLIEIEPGDDLKRAARLAAIFEKAGAGKPDVVLKTDKGDSKFTARAATAFPGATVFTSDLPSIKSVLKSGARPGVTLCSETAKFLRSDGKTAASLKKAGARLRVPSYLLLSESLNTGVDVSEAARLADAIGAKPEGLPECLGGIPSDPTILRLEAIRKNGDGVRMDLNTFAEDFIGRRMMTKSLRCAACPLDSKCPGIHLNHARRWGYAVLKPIMKKT